MWKRKKKEERQRDKKSLEIRDLSISDVRKAIHSYADDKPGNVPLHVIIKEDLTLDYELLAPYLRAIPKEKFYMSRETYELFEENNRQLALDLDLIQQAVDEYMQQSEELPTIEGDPYKRVNYYKLERLDLLPYRPDREFYITDEEFMVTYKKPSK